MTRPIICAIGISHRDIELATLWLRWVAFLAQHGRMGNLLVVHTHKTDPSALFEAGMRIPSLTIHRCEDEDEAGYPRSASHLFLRTLEMAERLYPGYGVLWCEADTVPMKPSWFAEIAAEYQTCGKPFLGVTVGKHSPQMSGIGVYPSDWRTRSPKLANVLSAPDNVQWGIGKGFPWDVFARDEVYPQMAESKLMTNIWKNRDVRATGLKDVPRRTVLFHQDKTGALIREIATLHYLEFMSTISQPRRFFFMNGHPTRLMAKGLMVKFSYTKFSAGYHRSAVCSDELSDEHASALATLVGQLGVREIDEAEFLNVTGRGVKSLPAPRMRSGVTPLATHEPAKYSHPNIYVMLGRYGDICNVLPMLKADADAGHRPTLVVSKDFADILDGVSYCDRIVWDGAYDQLPEALRWLRRDKGIVSPVVCQYHRNPFDKARLTDSYQKEVWRLAGRLDQFDSRGPLVFDQRDEKREEELVLAHGACAKPMVLVGLDSVSSPLANANAILSAVASKLSDTHEVVPLSAVKAERIYDLIGLFDAAALVIASDTAHIHLARASNVPLFAILNDGWRGSVVPRGTPHVRYSNAKPHEIADLAYSMSGLGAVTDVESPVLKIDYTVNRMQMASKSEDFKKLYPLFKYDPEKTSSDVALLSEPRVFHVCDPFGSDVRHNVAQTSWVNAYAEGMIPAHFKGAPRNAKTELKDPRALPFMKDVLWSAIPDDATHCGHDIIVWGNSDIGFAPGATAFIRDHVSKHHAASMRRTESNGNGHPGRDLFAFTVDFLMNHWEEIPDYVLGAPVFDLGMVAIIRRFHKLPALTLKNLGEDMPPADMPPGYALHQSHESEWCVRNMGSVPSYAHNRKLFQAWSKKYSPETKFSPAGNIK